MKPKRWQCRLLAGILIASLGFQSMAATAYASEQPTAQIQVEQEQETESAADAVTGSENVEETKETSDDTGKNSAGETETSSADQGDDAADADKTEEDSKKADSETEEEDSKKTDSETEVADSEDVDSKENAENPDAEVEDEEELELSDKKLMTLNALNSSEEIGTFENIKIIQSGFSYVITDGSFAFIESPSENATLYAIQYDKDDNELCKSILTTIYSGGINFSNRSQSFSAHERASHVRLEVAIGYSDVVSIFSDKFTLEGKRPNVTFCVDKLETASGTLIATVSYDGDLCVDRSYGYGDYLSTELLYGTSRDESTWKSVWSSLSYSAYGGDTAETKFTGLESEQSYYGKLIVYKELNDCDKGCIRVFEQSIPLNGFSTKTGNTYNLKETFPDEVLRATVLSKLKYSDNNLTEDSEVSSEMLEKITNLYINRENLSTSAIKDITGLDCLTGLTSVNLNNHEIDDITGIDWSKLTQLSSVYLQGNRIKKLPDWSKNFKLQSINMDRNMLSEQEISLAYEKLPDGVLFSHVDQYDGNEFELLIENKYYIYESGCAIYVKANGYTVLESLKIYLDEAEMAFKSMSSSTDGVILYADNLDLSVGEHTLKAKIVDGEEIIAETGQYRFEVVEQKLFHFPKENYYSGSRRSFYISAYSNNNKAIAKMTMVDCNGMVYGENSSDSVSISKNVNDPRFEYFSNTDIEKLYFIQTNIDSKYNVIPVGTYDVRIDYVDGSSDVLSDAIIIVDETETVLDTCGVGFDYDNTGDYVYLNLSGENIDPSRLNYNLNCDGINYPVAYLNYKQVYSGVIVKLQKLGWKKLTKYKAEVTISGKDDYEIVPREKKFDVFIHSNIYYSAYNPVQNKLEVAFANDIECNNKIASISVRRGYDSKQYPEIASGSATVLDGLAYFELKNSDGSAFVPTESGWYYFTCTVRGRVFDNSFYFNASNSDTQRNYWYAQSILKGTQIANCWYYTDFAFDGPDRDGAQYRAELVGEQLTSPIRAKGVETFESDGYVSIRTFFDASGLNTGTYQVNLYKENNLLASTTFDVLEANRFTLNYASLNWKSKSEIEVYVSTPNVGSTDTYKVILTDYEGNEVPGLITTVTNRYSNALYLSIKGLTYANAQRQYYVKIVHNKLGEPYTAAGQPYYSDSRGQLAQIYSSNNSYTTLRDGRIVGAYFANAKFPVTINIYKPYETDIIQKINVSSKSELTDSMYYYFSKSVIDSLPEKDCLYDVIIIDSDKRVSSNKGVLGYFAPSAVERVWDYFIDRTDLFVNTDDENVALLTVVENKKAPTYRSSDTSVATVVADKEDPTKAKITAVGMGVAEISITADGITKKFSVSVNRKIVLEELVLNKSTLSLRADDNWDLSASVCPAEAWTEDQRVIFTSSDPETVAVAQSEEDQKSGVARLTAMKAGTATITAQLEGKEFSATCEVTVYDSFTDDEIEEIVEQVGLPCILLNSYPSNVATLRDVKLPEGWDWEDPTVKLFADDMAPVQCYSARYEREGYEPFSAVLSVAVSKLTGVSVAGGSSVILSGYENEYQAACRYVGYWPNSNEYEKHLSYQWTVAGTAPVVTVEDDTKSVTMIEANGGITKNTSQSVTVIVTVDGDTKKTFKATRNLTVIPEPYVDEITIENISESESPYIEAEYDDDSQSLTIDYADISTAKGAVHNAVKLKATAKIGGEEGKLPKGIKWTSSDTSVVSVKAEKDNKNAVLTVKKAGSAVVHAIATDGGKYDKEIVVSVVDYSPILEAKSINVDLFRTEGTVIPVKPQNENTITAIYVLENGEQSDKFSVAQENGLFVIRTSNSFETTKNQTIKTVLQIETTRGTYQDSKLQAMSIVVNATKKPTASVKVKSKANLFYTDAEAVYTVTSANAIASIEDVTQGDGPRFHAEYDPNTGTISFDTNGTLDGDTLAKFKARNSFACKLRLKVKFAGYKDTASQYINVTVATEEKKLSLALNDLTFVPGVTESAVAVKDTKTKELYQLTANESIRMLSDTSKTNDVIIRLDESHTPVVTYDGDKAVSYKAELSSTEWTQSLTVSGKIAIAKLQTMVLDNPNIFLNTAHNIQENGMVEVGVSLKNNDGTVKVIDYQIDKKNSSLFNNGYVNISYNPDEQKLFVGLNKGKRGNIKAGKYTVNLYGVIQIGGQDVELKAVPLYINIVDKAPAVSLSGKGSVDLVRRDASSIVYTSKLTNVTASVCGAWLEGSNAPYFEIASVREGKIEIKAGEGLPMSTKLTYPVNVVVALDNGCEVMTTVKIKPINKVPKLKASVASATLYKASPETIKLTVDSMDTEIDDIALIEDKNSKYFDFVVDPVTKEVSVSLNDEARKMKPGKYTVSYLVYLKGAAYNVKPTTLKLVVTVK